MNEKIARMLRRAAVFALVAIFSAFAVAVLPACGSYIRQRAKFYITYCFSPASSAPSEELCEAVRSAGYAGYALSYGGSYYIVAACCEIVGEAEALAASLSEKGVESGTLAAERLRFELLTYGAEQNARLYEENISALLSISSELFSCLEILIREGREEARANFRSVHSDFLSLYSKNFSNCFTRPLAALCELSAECAFGAILARDVRYLSAAVADCLLSLALT